METKYITATVQRPAEKARRAAAMKRMQRRADICRGLFALAVAAALTLLMAAPLRENEDAAEQEAAPPTAVRETKHLTEDDHPASEHTALPEGRYDAISQDEREMIARLVYLEARGESAEGQQAVAEVVLNRAAADNFPDTIREVLYEGYGTDRQQFTPAGLLDTAEPWALRRWACPPAATRTLRR